VLPGGTQGAGEVLAGVALFDAGDFLGGAGGDQATAAGAAFGSQIDHPIGGLDDLQVVLDDDHGVAQLHQSVQEAQQFADVIEMETRRRLVQQIESASRRALAKLASQLDTLRLTSRQGGGGLPQVDIPQPHLIERRENSFDRWDIAKRLPRLLDRQIENIGDIQPFVPHGQSLAIVPAPTAHLAGDIDIGQEVHLDLDLPIALAGLTTPTLDVEAESAGLVPTFSRFRGFRHQAAKMSEDVGIGRRVRSGSAADGALVDGDDLVQMIQTLDPLVGTSPFSRPIEVRGQSLVEDVVDEAALAGTGHPRDDNEQPQR